MEIRKIFKSTYSRNKKITDMNSYSYSEALRNIIVIELLFATGARVSEISNLKIEDINILNGAVMIKGKGNMGRIIQICNNETLKILKNYHELFPIKNNFLNCLYNQNILFQKH